MPRHGPNFPEPQFLPETLSNRYRIYTYRTHEQIHLHSGTPRSQIRFESQGDECLLQNALRMYKNILRKLNSDSILLLRMNKMNNYLFTERKSGAKIVRLVSGIAFISSVVDPKLFFSSGFGSTT
jgi:hypothetical protein